MRLETRQSDRMYFLISSMLLDNGSLDSTTEDILVGRHVSESGHTFDRVEIIHCRVVQLGFLTLTYSFPHAGASPQRMNSVGHISGHNVDFDLPGEDSRWDVMLDFHDFLRTRFPLV